MTDTISTVDDSTWATHQAKKINESFERNRRYGCKLCNGKGYIAFVQGNTLKTKQCSCISAMRTEENIANSGMRKLVDTKTFETYEIRETWQKSIYNAALKFAENPKGWFFFGGQSGVGKTHLCVAITDRLFKAGYTVKYMRWRDDAPRLKALINSEKYDAEIKKYQAVECLYIDDLWKNEATNADILLVFQLLDYRYSNDLITIISSEKTIVDIVKIDEAIGGRIKEMCGKNMLSIAPDFKKNQRM